MESVTKRTEFVGPSLIIGTNPGSTTSISLIHIRGHVVLTDESINVLVKDGVVLSANNSKFKVSCKVLEDKLIRDCVKGSRIISTRNKVCHVDATVIVRP